MQRSVKLCECGCGLTAPVAPKTVPKYGYVQGMPLRFVKGHNQRRPIPILQVRLCECGCGAAAPVAIFNDSKRGFIKGRSHRFIQGHGKKNKPLKGYRSLMVAGRQRTIHRLRAERALGKPLPAGAVVHHADGSQSEHAPLVICQDQTYHMTLHGRMRLQAAGKDPWGMRA